MGDPEPAWRRFERQTHAHTCSRFWAIRVLGECCELHYGVVGADPSEAELEWVECGGARRARETAKTKIRSKLRAGWLEVEVEAEQALEADARELGEILQEALAEPDAGLDAWAVYADYLQGHDPLLGERLALGLARARAQGKRERAQLDSRIHHLETTRARDLFGPTISSLLGEGRFAGAVQLARRMGMITELCLRDLGKGHWDFDAIVEAVLELPICALVREIEIHAGPRRGDFARAIGVVLAKPPPGLRRLCLDGSALHRYEEGGVGGWQGPLVMPDTSALLEQVPGLERLELTGRFSGAGLRHDSLRELILRRVSVLEGFNLQGWSLPALEWLQVSDCFTALRWSEAKLPSLRHVLINSPGRALASLQALLASKLLDRLESLIIVESELNTRTTQLLLQHAERFAGLTRFVITEAQPRPEVVDPLRSRFAQLDLQTRAWPAHDRDGQLLREDSFGSARWSKKHRH